MKLKNGIYFLLLLIACKDGGDLTLRKDSGSLAWSFNQALAARAFSSGSNTNFSSNTYGSQFSLGTPTISFSTVTNNTNCSPNASIVSINNSNVQFEPGECRVNTFRFYSSPTEFTTKDYYSISVTRSYDLKTEYISILIDGSSPKSGIYQFGYGFESIYFSYDIYSRNVDGSFKNVTNYYARGGSISIDVSSGVFASTSFLQLRSYDAPQIQMKFGFGCCSK
jgi:hypothetical protein